MAREECDQAKPQYKSLQAACSLNVRRLGQSQQRSFLCALCASGAKKAYKKRSYRNEAVHKTVGAAVAVGHAISGYTVGSIHSNLSLTTDKKCSISAKMATKMNYPKRPSFESGKSEMVNVSVLKNFGVTEFTEQFDYAMVFKTVEGKDGSSSQSAACKTCLNAMLTAGLEAFPYLSCQKDEVYVLIRAPVSFAEPAFAELSLPFTTFFFFASF